MVWSDQTCLFLSGESLRTTDNQTANRLNIEPSTFLLLAREVRQNLEIGNKTYISFPSECIVVSMESSGLGSAVNNDPSTAACITASSKQCTAVHCSTKNCI